MSLITYDEHYCSAYGPFVQERRLAGSTPLTMLEIHQPAGDFPDPPVSDLVFLQLKSSARGRWDFGAGRIHTAEAGRIHVIPPRQATDVVMDAPHRFRTFSIPGGPALVCLRECLDGKTPDFSRLQIQGTHSQFLNTLLSKLWTAGAVGGEIGRVFADGALLGLLAEVGRDLSSSRRVAKGGLSLWQMRRVTDFIEETLDRDLSLADLAGEAGISRFHFSRAFKDTTGLTPFQFLTKRRIAKAQGLLQERNVDIAQVALACGFASQSTFTTAFRRETGTTPAKWYASSRAS